MRKSTTKLLMALLVAAFSALSVEAASTVKPKKGMNLVGVVTDGTEPMAGVVVSDGVNVVMTDAKGEYQMHTDSARFVFVSLPSYCKIPMKDGYPCIYQEIALDGKKSVQRDFVLERQPIDQRFLLVTMADVQIQNTRDLGMLQTDVMDDFTYAVNALGGTVIGLTLGDNVWDNMPFYEKFMDVFRKLDIPVFPVIGNHDHDLRTPVDYMADHAFKDNFGPTYYSFNRGDVHIIAMDDINYSGRKNYTEEFSKEQIEWLKKDLEFVPEDKFIVIGFHAPTTHYGGKPRVLNAQEFYDVLAGRKVQLLAGHLHSNHHTVINDNIQEHSVAAFMGAFWNGDLCPDGSPRGFGVYQFDGNKLVDSYYQGHCHPRSYQMYVYRPGQAIEDKYKDGIIANVFNAGSNWTVEINEDDAGWKPMEKFKGIDPRAYFHLYGKHKPAYRGYAEPRVNNPHLYYYKPASESWNKAQVRATDPHGNVYTETVTNNR
ncbi:MAG: calcineurin-like phosphoesterase family protein [Muribaculaceae bacterium]|nr:calcineurin-like phosphoesterase family protein [Muribaculaceae bacterium]